MRTLITIAASLFLISVHQVVADEIPASLCEELQQSAAEMNANAPTNIDNETEFLLLTVNCVGNMVSFTKRLINFHSSVMLPGWQDRKQLSHTQLHCNRNGLATAGISVMDTIHNPDGSFAAKFVTRPADCQKQNSVPTTSSRQVENFGVKGVELGGSKKEVEAYLDAYPLDCKDTSTQATDCLELSIPITVANYLCFVNQLLYWSDEPLDPVREYLERNDDRFKRYEDQSKLYSARIVCGDANGSPSVASPAAEEQASSDEDRWGLIEAALVRKYGEPSRSSGALVWSNGKQRITLMVNQSVELELVDLEMVEKREADDAARKEQHIQESLEDI
jgi:hypothetical protein